jgi:hypothetical protein
MAAPSANRVLAAHAVGRDRPAADLARSVPLDGMLRIACACEFVGHGAFGITTKAA